MDDRRYLADLSRRLHLLLDSYRYDSDRRLQPGDRVALPIASRLEHAAS